MIIKKRKAFALVLALAMMGFMVLLVVTLATMVQMQMRMSRQTLIDQKARQAAKFAAFQAMNAVQVALGPDQRISANAMMFDDQLAKGITDLDRNTKYTWWENPMDISREDVDTIENNAISENRYWVGVWDAAVGKSPAKFRYNDDDRTSYAERMSKSALTWLVSGNNVRSQNDTEGTDITYRPVDTLEKGKYVRAVSSGSSVNESISEKDIDVRAPIITLDKDTNGITGEKIEDGKETRIAWWVADEGQKASLNAIASKEQLTHAQGITFRLQSLPFYSGIHALSVSNFGNKSGIKAFNLFFDDDDEQTGSLAKIRNLDDIRSLDLLKSDNVTASTPPSKVFFHSATFGTKGVLSNTREGGLKKDLTLGLIRKEGDNEPETPKDATQTTPPSYFERPYGIAGYEYKTSTAYPILPFSAGKSRRNLTVNKLKFKGHMFGPQQYGHEDIEKTGIGFDSASAIAVVTKVYDDTYLYKDPGGPLWDQLRSYYNLRVNDSGTTQLKPRQQTDDRYGFKPVVKRFQIFFVPSFIDYSTANGGTVGDYGIRLHIIPLLVLWNPYDTKIEGGVYYVIRLCNLKASNALGVFRLAVGFVGANNRFQCLRDYRAEKIPVSSTWGYTFKLSNYNSRGHNYSNNTLAPAVANTGSTAYNMSKKTAWYQKMFYPLGYGEIASSDAYESNKNYVYQTSSQTVEYPGLTVNESQKAMVTKVPLFLNNMVVSIEHGNYYTQYGSSYYGFNIQQEIDEPNPWSSSYAQDISSYGVGDMHFVVYDKSGIPAGKAKLFAMKKVLNYIGRPTNSLRANVDGPNGALVVNGENKYEKFGAMLHGVDDGGIPGNCFYMDVPHPEVEHIARYNRNRTYDNKPYEVLFNLQEVSQNQKGYGNVTIPNDIEKMSVDLQPVVGIWTDGGSRYPFSPTRNSTPLFYGQAALTVKARSGDLANPTASEGPWWTGTAGDGYLKSTGDYWRLFMQIFIWKYDSGDVENFSKTGVLYKRGGTNEGSPYWQQLFTLPAMTYVNGMRIMADYYNQSFPDPSCPQGSTTIKNYRSNGIVVGNNRNYYVTPFANYESETWSNAKYFLSWMQINARRHSANFWMAYGASTTSKSVDAAPSAKSGLFVTKYQQGGYNYGETLDSHIRTNTKDVQYGYLFGLPYAQETVGFQPIFNRRMFVNNDIHATGYDTEYSPREITMGDNAYGSSVPSTLKTVYRDIGKMQTSYMGMGLVQGENDDGISDLGYQIYNSGGYVSIGSSMNQGVVYESVTHHILRENEVVSNPAALGSAGLSFGVGSTYFGYNTNTTLLNAFIKTTSGNNSPESLQTTFAVGNSLCPSRVAPERNFEVMWIDNSSQWTPDNSGGNSDTQPDGKRDNSYYSDKVVLYDMAFNLNNILWDEYFFSTLPYRNDEAEIAQSGEYVVPQNPRLCYYVSDDEKLTTTDLKSTSREDQFSENAAKLWINGPFNVNSTSVDAWKAVLATYYNVTVEGYSSGRDGNTNAAPFHRYSAPYVANAFTSSSSISNEEKVFNGYRSLDDDELEQLASAIVEHVKDRGPFYSLSDFVNRRVDNYAAEQRYHNSQLKEAGRLPTSYTDPKKFSYVPSYSQYDDRADIDDTSKSIANSYTSKIAHLQKGVLQAAIDGTEINNAFHKDEDLIISVENDRNMSEAFKYDDNYKIFRNPTDMWENWRGAVGPQLTGAPTYLMQQDILARIGSFITVRSDTFKIRAYGEIRNPISGIVEGKAWCEMVVQRVPDYICSELSNQEAWRVSDREIEAGTQNGQKTMTGEDLDGIMDELEPVNKALGRRFKVVSFKWLSDKEI